MCSLQEKQSTDSEKKKTDPSELVKETVELPVPSKSEIVRQDHLTHDKNKPDESFIPGKHDPIIEKAAKTFSIKDLINDTVNSPSKAIEGNDKTDSLADVPGQPVKDELTSESFEKAWKDFTAQLQGEGTRIISMFNSVIPEMENTHTIKIHLSNAAQKDTFIQHYKQKLITFLERKFEMKDIDIEALVDVADSGDIIYSDEQKSNYLFNKYPLMKEMKKTFNLDIN